jgi:hypothetical protein
VVLWVESDRPIDEVNAGLLAEQIRLRVRPWTHARVQVTCHALARMDAFRPEWLKEARLLPRGAR